MNNFIEVLTDMLNYFDNINNQYKYYQQRKQEFEDFDKDVRHIYELADIDAIDMMKLASEYRKLTKERRNILDYNRYLCCMHGLFEKHKDFFQEIEYVLGQLKKIENENENRKYYAKSKVGQQLIDKFSKKTDCLVTTPDESKLLKLKDAIEMKNCV